MSDESSAVHLSIGLGFFGDGTLQLHYPYKYAEELSSLLDRAGLEHEPVLAHSDVPDVFIEAIRVLGPGGGVATLLTALSVALNSLMKTIAHRNDGKRVVLDGQEISGFSVTEVNRILRERAQRLEERDTRKGPDGQDG
jgi:hypothetical protein